MRRLQLSPLGQISFGYTPLPPFASEFFRLFSSWFLRRFSYFIQVQHELIYSSFTWGILNSFFMRKSIAEAKLGIYPPTPASLAGRLTTMRPPGLESFWEQDKDESKEIQSWQWQSFVSSCTLAQNKRRSTTPRVYLDYLIRNSSRIFMYSR